MFGLTRDTLVTLGIGVIAIVVLGWLFILVWREDIARERREARDAAIGRDQYQEELRARLRLLQKDRAVWDVLHRAPDARRGGR